MKKLSIVLYLFSAALLVGQSNNGILTGKIIDAVNKQGIPGATILIAGTGFGAAADENGNFVIRNIPPNSYQVSASAVGYISQIKTDVPIANSRPAQLDFMLMDRALQLQSVTVSAGYFEKNNNQFNSVTAVGYEELRSSAGGFEDVVRAISVLPGVVQADAGRNDLIVRGGAPSENLYILDGFEVPTINHFGTQGATGGPLSFINLDFVKNTTFSTGGFPVLYGDKLSSVLAVDLRNGREDHIGGKATISASQFGLNMEGPASGESQFVVSARRSYLDFIFKAAGFGFVPEYWDFLTKYDYSIDRDNSISFLTIMALDNIRYFNSNADQRYDNSRILGSEQVQYVSGLAYRHLLQNGYIKIHLSRNYVDYNTVQRDSLLQIIFLNNSLESENRFKIEYVSKMMRSVEVNLGGEVKYVRFDADVKFPAFRTSFNELLPYNAASMKRMFLKYSLFANVSYNFLEHIAATGGARMDYFDGIDNRFSISPRIAFSYLMNDRMELNFSTGFYYQNPSYIWLAYGNTNLNPIKMNQYIAGFEWQAREDTRLKTEIYYKHYADYPTSQLRPYLTLANTGAGFAGADDNFSAFGLEPLLSEGIGAARGIELSVKRKCRNCRFMESRVSLITSLNFLRWIISQDTARMISAGYLISAEGIKLRSHSK